MIIDLFETQVVIIVCVCVAVLLATTGIRPTFQLARNVALFSAVTITLLAHGHVPYDEMPIAGGGVRPIIFALAKGVWWITGAMLLISLVRLFLIFEKMPREAKLVQDVVVGLIYLGTALSIVAFVFSVPVGTLIATSGVLALILGLALQSTLNDVFSGIALNLGRTYTVGDWLVIDDNVQGRVVETNWRATHLLNGTNDLAVIPNSVLAKAKLVNFSSPDDTHGLVISLRIATTTSPGKIIETMQSVLLSSNAILRAPMPVAVVTGVDSDAVDIDLIVRLANVSNTSTAKNEVYDLAFRHAKAAGLRLARPVGTSVVTVNEKKEDQTPSHPGTPWRLLNSVALFDTLTEDEKESLAANMIRRTFKKDTVIVDAATTMQSLMLIRSGVVQVDRPGAIPGVEMTRLAPGDCFGERGVLMDYDEPGTIRAVTFVVTYEISKEHLAAVMHDRPQLAEELGKLFDGRSSAIERIISGIPSHQTLGAESLSERIRRAFGI